MGRGGARACAGGLCSCFPFNLPRARRLTQARGIDWPERFESATWELLRTTLGTVPE